MTNTQAELREKFSKQHEKWLIGTCDDAEAAQEWVMENLPSLLALLPPAPAVGELTDEMLCAGSDKLCFELGLPQVDHRGTILNVWKVMQDKAIKAAYEEGMMHLMRVRTFAERANDELIKLGELLEQQGAKNADNDRTS